MVKLGCKRNQITRMFQLFMKIDEDDSGMITLDEFFKYLNTDWSPFIGRAFNAMDSDKDGLSADQLEPDEWLIGLFNYCTLTPEALARFAFELYDDDGSEFISHDELETMVDDVFGSQNGFSREDHVKQLVDILDADGNGVIEYEEWRKVAGKATSILKPAIVLQAFLQSKCFGQSFWSREKARVVPMLHKSNYPNVLQFYRKEVIEKKPDAVEAALAAKWLGEEGAPDVKSKDTATGGPDGASGLNLKGVLKAKMLAKSVHEKVERQKDPTEHGFSNPFRNAKVSSYGGDAVKLGDFDENEFYYEDENFGEDGPTPQQLLQRQIRMAKQAAPHEGKNTKYGHSIVYPDGTTILPVPLKDRTHENQKEIDKQIKDKWNPKKKKLTKEEVESIEDAEKRKRKYRSDLIKFAKAKVDCEMDKFDLYLDPRDEPPEKFWEVAVDLGKGSGEEKKVG
ncbi:hypothetical protein TL16_g01773 [Triparma laevis f. inornata]|uniref:EF-hand domain-containing protein n=1 Tax=Triparma laevis f. inornata TaxID=1714386 RepID=A0A9W6ZP76_9STRA|nr:hypothetical protein TL16_g01773 [Triparma laevis f. inornata]